MPREKKTDIWKNFHILDSVTGTKKAAKCKHCGKLYENANVTRMTDHLAKCPQRLKYTENDCINVDADEREIDENQSQPKEPARPQATITMTSEGEPPAKKPHTTTHSVFMSASNPSTSKTLHSVATFMDTIKPNDQLKAEVLLARAVYASNCPLSILDNQHWQNLFAFLRPAFTLPSTYKISEPLLEEEFERVTAEIQNSLAEATACALITDGWSNISGDGILNFIVTTPKPLFYMSINRGTERETAKYISDQICNILEEIGPEKFLLLVTDCASNMTAAWKLVNEKYGHISAVGCADHALQNFVVDLMKTRFLKKIIKAAKHVVSEIKHSHVKLALFKEKQKQFYGSKATTLKLYPKTRFSYAALTLKSLADNQEALQAVAIDASTGITRKIKKRILDEEDFWPKVKLALKILAPIASCVSLLEREQALLSEVIEAFSLIKKNIEGFLGHEENDLFSVTEEIEVVKCMGERFKRCIQPIHCATHLLDPRFKGRNLSGEQLIKAYQYLDMLAAHLKLESSSEQILEDLGNFRDNTGFYTHQVLSKAATTHNPSSWWRGLCGSQPLAPLASKLLQLPPTNSASERNWSQQAAVHTASRNRLNPDRVRKIVTIRNNLNEKRPKCKKTISFFQVSQFFAQAESLLEEIEDEEFERADLVSDDDVEESDSDDE